MGKYLADDKIDPLERATVVTAYLVDPENDDRAARTRLAEGMLRAALDLLVAKETPSAECVLDRIDALFVDEETGKSDIDPPQLTKDEIAGAKALLKSREIVLEDDVERHLKAWIASSQVTP